MLVLVVINAYTYQGEPLPEGSESAERLAMGPFESQKILETFVDYTRPTQENRGHPAIDSRTLKTNIWFPANSQSNHPLIIYSHGISSNKDNTPLLQEYLASHGYVVIAPNYPLSNTFTKGGAMAFDILNQAGDISYLIDQAISLSESDDSPLSGLVDNTRIGVVGISLGGLTSKLAAYHRDVFDPRIDVAISIAGPSAFFTPQYYQTNPIPLLMIGGSADTIVSYDLNARPITETYPGTGLLTLDRGSHAGFADAIAKFRWLGNPDDIACWAVNRSLDEQTDPRWDTILGPPWEGVDINDRTMPCEEAPPEDVMNPVRQNKITRVAVRAFFESFFLDGADERAAAGRFVRETISGELEDVSYMSKGS